ncbi:MAG: hypothetical protein AAFY71_20810 [Bacteroidota bacterium]
MIKSLRKFLILLIFLLMLILHSFGQFEGGNGDGFVADELLAVSLQNNAIINIFEGGDGDGYQQSVVTQVYLDGNSPSILFAGGNGDGASVEEIQFAFSSLPIVLSNFTADWVQSGVELRWTAELETPGSTFQIEKSQDGLLFQPFGQVIDPDIDTGKYLGKAVDRIPYEGVSYYRLRLMEPTGWIDYSDIVEVAVDENRFTSITCYPNPNPGQAMYIRMQGKVLGEVPTLLSMVDASGRELFQSYITEDDIEGNVVYWEFPFTLGRGLYFLRMINPEQKSFFFTLLVEK